MFIFSTAITTYLYFYIIVHRIHKKSGIERNRCKRRNVGFRRFRVPFLVLLTFILFNITCTILLTISSYSMITKDLKILLIDLGTIFEAIGHISDACIYIFLQRKVLDRCFVFISKVRRYRKTSSSDEHERPATIELITLRNEEHT